jgi:hypothetical protein
MKKSEANAAQGELAKSKLEAPVRLTPEQLETVAGGFKVQLSLETGGKGSTTTTGAHEPTNPFKLS